MKASALKKKQVLAMVYLTVLFAVGWILNGVAICFVMMVPQNCGFKLILVNHFVRFFLFQRLNFCSNHMVWQMYKIFMLLKHLLSMVV